MYISLHTTDDQEYEPFRSALKKIGFNQVNRLLSREGTSVYILEPQNEVMIRYDCVGDSLRPEWNMSMMRPESKEAIRVALEYIEPIEIKGHRGSVDEGELIRAVGFEQNT